MNFGPMEIALIFLAILLLFGYKKLPDASRSLGRSMRIFKGEMKGMKEDAAKDASSQDASAGIAVRGEPMPPVTATSEGRLNGTP